MSLRSALVVLAFLTVFCKSADAGLIDNGGFEVPSVGLTGISGVGPSSEPLGFGWDVNSGNVEVFGDLYPSLSGPAFDGIQLLDLNGLAVGTISQAFVTLPGRDYQLTFAYANNYVHTHPSSPATATVRVVDTASLSNVVTPLLIAHGSSTSADLDWTVAGLTFTATGASTTLRFESTSTATPWGGILLDGVDVTGPLPATVPEPSGFVSAAILVSISLVASKRTSRRKLPSNPQMQSAVE